MIQRPYRNLGLDLVRATEGAALAAGQWMGLGRPDEADRHAYEVMMRQLGAIEIAGRIVIREAEGGGGLSGPAQGEVGAGTGLEADVVLDPIDGRQLLAQGLPGALSAIAVAPRGAFWTPPPVVYMEKIVVDATVAPYLVPECLDAPAAWTLALVARAKEKRVSDLIAFVLDRPRHAHLIGEIRAAGARAMLRSEGDISGALMAVFADGGIDVLIGTGGVCEGLIAAAAVKAAGGAMLGRLAPHTAAERAAIIDPARIYTVDDMVSGDQVFFAATGITDGPLLSGVHYHGGRAASNSMILRGETHTRRIIQAEHQLTEYPH